jgi:hypothetical protein
MPQVSLQRPRIDAVIRELVATGVAQHVGVRLNAELGRRRSSTRSLGGGGPFASVA